MFILLLWKHVLPILHCSPKYVFHSSAAALPGWWSCSHPSSCSTRSLPHHSAVHRYLSYLLRTSLFLSRSRCLQSRSLSQPPGNTPADHPPLQHQTLPPLLLRNPSCQDGQDHLSGTGTHFHPQDEPLIHPLLFQKDILCMNQFGM